MASSPADPAAPLGPAAFAWQELTACWDQAYEALLGGDLDRVQDLLEVADEHVANLATVADDDPATTAPLRQDAQAARARLDHGMRAGLQGLREEMARARQGARVLQGYRDPNHGLGGWVARSV